MNKSVYLIKSSANNESFLTLVCGCERVPNRRLYFLIYLLLGPSPPAKAPSIRWLKKA